MFQLSFITTSHGDIMRSSIETDLFNTWRYWNSYAFSCRRWLFRGIFLFEENNVWFLVWGFICYMKDS